MLPLLVQVRANFSALLFCADGENPIFERLGHFQGNTKVLFHLSVWMHTHANNYFNLNSPTNRRLGPRGPTPASRLGV